MNPHVRLLVCRSVGCRGAWKFRIVYTSLPLSENILPNTSGTPTASSGLLDFWSLIHLAYIFLDRDHNLLPGGHPPLHDLPRQNRRHSRKPFQV